jgi:hypothetical protein
MGLAYITIGHDDHCAFLFPPPSILALEKELSTHQALRDTATPVALCSFKNDVASKAWYIGRTLHVHYPGDDIQSRDSHIERQQLRIIP